MGEEVCDLVYEGVDNVAWPHSSVTSVAAASRLFGKASECSTNEKRRPKWAKWTCIDTALLLFAEHSNYTQFRAPIYVTLTR